MLPIKRLIQSRFHSSPIGTELQRSQIIDLFRELLAKHFSPAILQRVSMVHLHNGVLTVVVTTPVLMQEIVQRREQLLSELRTRIGDRAVTEIKTSL